MFKPFGEAVQLRFMEMSEGELFVVKAENIFERYLAAFPEGSNPILKVRTEHDCNCCKQFVRRLGIVVGIKGDKYVTVWGGLDIPQPYKAVADAMDAYIRTCPIESVFRTDEKKYGNEYNYDSSNNRWEHFVGHVDKKHCVRNPDALRGERASVFQVFQRGVKELREEDFEVVLDLIESNNLYKGQEFKPAILAFQKLLKGYKASGSSALYVWDNLSNPFASFRNTAIGTLFIDLADGKELDQAVNAYEAKVSANTYKRTTSAITQKMVEQAVQTLHDLGLSGATQRRFARISDISVNDVLFVDNGTRSKMKDGITALLESSVVKAKPDLKGAEKITADDFLARILPGAKSVEVLVENRHSGNFVSLTGADGPERMFKWDNNFAWAYDGDFTDSVKQRVKAAGGNINADLRVSLSWFNFDDLDLHALTPYGHVYFREKMGILDVDMNAGSGKTRTPVENLAFNKPRNGIYKVQVHQFCQRETTDFGFAIEIECDGVLRQFSYAKALRTNDLAPCFQFTVTNGRVTDLKSDLVEGTASQDKWGIKTETLVPATIIAFSPNYWGHNVSGAKHLIFGLQGCQNPTAVRGIFNEYLRSEFEKHRKVFEVLGAKTKCKPTDDQISGVGFTAARGDSVTIVVDGRRPYTLRF